MTASLILASASPRRHALLAEAGFEFTIEVSDVEENFEPGTSPEEVARQLAERKARHVAARHQGEACRVVGADTVVAVEVDGELRILGKPEDETEARRMLEALSSSRQRVVTGVCVVDCASGDVVSEFERTWVSMRRIEPAEVEAYVASGEWRGKAGGYAIQENADAFVTALEEGGFDNVVGLPVERTRTLLERMGHGRR